MALIYPLQRPFRDEESVVLDILVAYFATEGTTIHADTETPNANVFQDVLDDGVIVRVGRVGGASEVTQDNPVLDVDVLARTRGEAKRVAQLIEQLLISAPHPIDKVQVLMSPQKVEWQEGSPIRRFYASYHLTLRR